MSERSTSNRGKRMNIGRFISVLRPLLDEDRAMQLDALYIRFRNKEILEADFIKSIKNIAGANTLNMALRQIESEDARSATINASPQVPIQQQSMPNVVQIARFGLHMSQDNLVSSSASYQSASKTPQFAIQQQIMPTEVQLAQFGQNMPRDNLVSSPTPNQSAWKTPQQAAIQNMPSGVQMKKLGLPVGQKRPLNDLVSSSTPNQSASKTPGVQPAQFGLNMPQDNLVSSQVAVQDTRSGVQMKKLSLPVGQKRPLNDLVSSSTPNQSASKTPQFAIQQPTGVQPAQFGLNMPQDNLVSSQIAVQDTRSGVQMKKLGLPVGQKRPLNDLDSSSTPNQSASKTPGVQPAQFGLNMPQDNLVSSQVAVQDTRSGVQMKKLGLPVGQKRPLNDLVSSSTPNQSSWQTPQVAMQQQHMSSVVQNKRLCLPVGQKKPLNLVSSPTPNQYACQTPQVTIQQQNTQSVVGLKKPLDDLVSSPTPSRKKQKVSDAAETFQDQTSIEHLNDVTAVSGVNLMEEEEKLLPGRRRDTGIVSKASRIVQGEEDRLFLERIPLQKKLKEIVSKCGLKGASKDVERCLSQGVEERLRGLIGNLMRLSKQRDDVEKFKHRHVVTSDVRNQLMQISRKPQQQQTAAENVQTQTEADCEKAAEVLKKNQEDEIRATKANAAVRAAAGGSDMLSRWKMMAEKAKQKGGGVTNKGSCAQPEKLDIVRKTNTLKGSRDKHEDKKKAQCSTSNTTQGEAKRDAQLAGRSKISVKDVIAALERDPMMSKSTLIHKFYEKNYN